MVASNQGTAIDVDMVASNQGTAIDVGHALMA